MKHGRPRTRSRQSNDSEDQSHASIIVLTHVPFSVWGALNQFVVCRWLRLPLDFLSISLQFGWNRDYIPSVGFWYTSGAARRRECQRLWRVRETLVLELIGSCAHSCSATKSFSSSFLDAGRSQYACRASAYSVLPPDWGSLWASSKLHLLLKDDSTCQRRLPLSWTLHVTRLSTRDTGTTFVTPPTPSLDNENHS